MAKHFSGRNRAGTKTGMAVKAELKLYQNTRATEGHRGRTGSHQGLKKPPPLNV